ncbi:DUF1929 domain-containing protein [Oxalobacteraceae bacterium R-40]|uniref:DUF1929 domain-containing protein n=1 Tax=Keguizhuia sedimenti TaxID=3064264 RepID=A0ABU1BMI2_9BURK|nr:DUF1929 domain-containing protein [Oxalobacteraceae bacterium R-40]
MALRRNCLLFPSTLILLSTLSACGGGGGGGGSDNTLGPSSGGTSSKPMGQWSPVYEWPQVAINLTLMPDGKLMSWSRLYDNHTTAPDQPGEESAEVYLVDVPNGGIPTNFSYIPNPTTKIFCGGQTFLPDGRLFIAGGENAEGGSDHANIFDFRNNSWQRVADMNGRRWYPTTTTLANGDILTLGGTMTFAGVENNSVPQVWTTSGWRTLSSANYDVGEYPRMHLAPNGQVFKSGISPLSRYLDTSGTGNWTDVATLNHAGYRSYGSSVMYGDGKVLVMGGGDIAGTEAPTNTAEIIDLYDAEPAWKFTKPMHIARRQLNATIMADGKILVTGGMSGTGTNDASTAVLPAEMWDPETGNWTLLASMKIPRVYHSTALLLPDGRILSAGGGQPAALNGVDNHNAEIFSPPYLFKGPRPVITSAPQSVNYGQRFFVQTPDAGKVVKATWIRLGSVTHAFNMNQRINHLAVTPATGGLNIVAPSDSNLTPPGHYMLFLLNDKGVPSIARIIQIT